MAQTEEVLAAKLDSLIAEWEEETGAMMTFRLFESEFGGGSGAREALCHYLARRLQEKDN